MHPEISSMRVAEAAMRFADYRAKASIFIDAVRRGVVYPRPVPAPLGHRSRNEVGPPRA
jgi:hypothetical protein